MKRAVIISGGKIQSEFALDFLRKNPYEILIAADRGMVFCREHGIKPGYIVGDFDSAGEEELDYFRKFSDIPVRRFNPVKDFTDTELAVKLALELNAGCITILGGTGSRLDHVAANIRILDIARRAGAEAYLVDECNRIRLIDKEVILEKKKQFGRYVSLFAFGGMVRNLTLEGFRYPLSNYCMAGNDPLGVSNEMENEICRIFFSKGILMLIESKD